MLEAGLDSWGGGRSACRREPFHIQGERDAYLSVTDETFARMSPAAKRYKNSCLCMLCLQHRLLKRSLRKWCVQSEREQLTQLVFEHNNVAGFFLCDQPLLSLYAVGRLSGCVVDYGHEKTGGGFGILSIEYAASKFCNLKEKLGVFILLICMIPYCNDRQIH